MDKSALPPLNRRRISEPARPTRIVQFGEGNFLRAFVDWMIHRMNQQADFNTGVAVIQPIANGLIDVLNQQDGLYTLYLNGVKDGKVISKHELISCIQKGVNPYRHYDEYLEEAENLCRNIAIIDSGEIIENTSMRSLLSKLTREVLVLDLDESVSKDILIEGFECRWIDSYSIEIEVKKGQPLNRLFDKLSALGITVNSLRNKSNRLEEMFVSLLRNKKNTSNHADKSTRV